jgi:hypothetical protein
MNHQETKTPSCAENFILFVPSRLGGEIFE